ncbi:MAG: lytic transglycosylase domain-containing protein [Clostridia bacterium]|nr:lytic transglycosylase domain-containing protein [Clostridia bacterium]
MKKTEKGRRLCAALALLLGLACLSACLFDFCADRRRNAREAKVYDAVLSSAAAYGVSPALVLAVVRTESDFFENAVSDAGAMGLMQLMPDTFSYLRDEHFAESLPDTAVWEPAVNIRYGTYYLAYLYDRFGNWQATLAAYNAGEGRVADWLCDPTLSPDGKSLTDIPYPETKAYVAKVLSHYRAYLEKYHFKE